MFNNINDVYDYLYNQRKTSKRENLNRIKNAYKLLNLDMNYKIIHITGTNGKGSVAVTLKNILQLMGNRVGMFVSPYVINFNERIQINERFISDAEIIHYANILYEFNENYYKEYNDKLPFFELTFLMALMYFKDRNIDYAVIECGLGGLLDSTNFIDSDLSIITNVGFDHMAQLGNTKEEILKHKIGILKPNSTLITVLDNELKDKMDLYAKNINSNIIYVNNIENIKLDDKTNFTYKGVNYQTKLLGEYQAYNMALAIEAIKYFYNDINGDIINLATSNIIWPGRFEIIKNKPLVIIDGAHNISAIEKLVSTIKKYYSNYKIKILFSALSDKDYKKMINKLDEISSFYYFTSIDDVRADNSINFQKFTDISSMYINNDKESINKIINDLSRDELLLITGSLHFISIERNIILELNKKGN